MKKNCFVLLNVLFLSIIITGCATTVSKEVIRPAELNLPDVESVCILPFKSERIDDFFLFFRFTKDSDREADRLARMITAEIKQKVLAENIYSVVESGSVLKSIDAGGELPCDIYLTGYLDDYSSNILRERCTKTDEDGNEIEYYEFYRTAECHVVYQVIDPKDNRVLFIQSEKLSAHSWNYRSRGEVPDGDDVLESEVQSFARMVARKIQPYHDKVYYTLLEDKTKDPDMKYANSLAKKGSYLDSAYAFYDLYLDKGYYEAGYNAAILFVVEGDLVKAKELLEELNQKYDNKRTKTMLDSLSRDYGL